MIESFVRFVNAWWWLIGSIWLVFGLWAAWVHGFLSCMRACRVEDDLQEWPSERGLL